MEEDVRGRRAKGQFQPTRTSEKQDGVQAKETKAMNIGNLKLNRGSYVGTISTLRLQMAVALKPVDSENENAPKYEVHARSPNGQYVQVGALWEKASNSTGELFLQGRIDDPSLAAPVSITAFEQDDKSYNVVWQRPRPRGVNFGEAANNNSDGDDQRQFA